MLSWYSLSLVVVCVLLTTVVVRLSEISTRLQLLDPAMAHCVAEVERLKVSVAEHVTHRDLRAVMDYVSQPYFTVGADTLRRSARA